MVRSRTIFWNVVPASALPATVLFTVPAQRTLIVRRVVAVNAAAVNSLLTIQHGRGAPAQIVLSQQINALNVPIEFNVYWILDPGDDLRATQSAVGGLVAVTGYGTLLLGAPA